MSIYRDLFTFNQRTSKAVAQQAQKREIHNHALLIVMVEKVQ
jgi:hypothetical protein